MIRKHQCIEVTCDDCGDDCWDDGTPHFGTLAEAQKHLGEDGEWLLTEAEQVCRSCRNARICASEGHDWGHWFRSKADPLMAVRLCERCSALDYTVAVAQESSGGESDG